jgi:AhpD family alkylhydroperoxidase
MSQRVDYVNEAPAGLRALGGVHVYVANCGLPRELVDLVYLRVSQINGCAYCVAEHSRDLRQSGMPIEKLVLVSVWRESDDVFTAQERAALCWAESLTLISQTGAPDDDYQTALEQFDAKALVDLTIAIGLMNTYNRIAIGFRRGPEVQPPA